MKKGLFQKYIVTRADGRKDPEAKYIVLRYDGRKHKEERRVIHSYALGMATSNDYEQFGKELLTKITTLIRKFRKEEWEEYKVQKDKEFEEESK